MSEQVYGEYQEMHERDMAAVRAAVEREADAAMEEAEAFLQRLPISLSEKRCEYRGHTLVTAQVCRDCGLAFTEAEA